MFGAGRAGSQPGAPARTLDARLLERLAAVTQPIYGDSLTTQVPAFCVLTVLASNVVSNVPFVILARDMMGQPDGPGR